MKLSVIVGAYNTHEMTLAHVKHCMKYSIRTPDEIIVTNDGGDPSLRDMLFNLERACPIIYTRILQDIPWNYTGARNLGAVLARGKYIAIEDSDHFPYPDFYKNAEQLLDDHPEYLKIPCKSRAKITLEDALLGKDPSKWKILGKRGSHPDSGVYRRLTYLSFKGMDERFAGLYGWAVCDIHFKIKKVSQEFCSGSYFVIVDGVDDELLRKQRADNHKLWKQCHKRVSETGILTCPNGMLNFDYTVEVMEKNI